MSEVNKVEDEQNARGIETSILFEPIAVGIIVISLLAAIWFKFLPLLLVSTFLLLLASFIFIWKRLSLKGLHATLHVPTSRVFAGDDFVVHATVKNNKWLPLIWLEWEFPKSERIRWGSEQHETYIARFLWLLWYQKVDWTIKGRAVQRGVYDIGRVSLRSGDGFRFTENEMIVPLHERMYIYPQLIPVQVPSFSTSLQWEVTGRKGGFLEDPLLISGVRDYEAGDEWRRINPKASARLGKLQTNVYEPVVSKQIILYIDVKGYVIRKNLYENEPLKQEKYERFKKVRFEQMLQTVASIAVTYDERGIKVGFASNSLNYLSERSASVSPNEKITFLLDELAMMEQQVATRRMTPLDELIAKGIRTCPIFIFTERLTKEHIDWYEKNSRKYDIHFYYGKESERVAVLQHVAKRIDRLRLEAAVSE